MKKRICGTNDREADSGALCGAGALWGRRCRCLCLMSRYGQEVDTVTEILAVGNMVICFLLFACQKFSDVV